MTKLKLFVFCFCLFGINLANSQTITLKGSVKDSLQNPLAYTNVIAKPQDAAKNLKFSITDDDGYYKLELTKGDSYTLSVSYLGYKTVNFDFVANENSQKNLILKDAPNQLKEVLIELPVSVKEDSTTQKRSLLV